MLDADRVVHKLYSGRGAEPVERLFPGVVCDGVVDRARLRAEVFGNPLALSQLETLIHPMVQEEEQRFLVSARQLRAPIALLEIPLLFESAAVGRVDVVVVVSTDKAIQRTRVLGRVGMSDENFAAIARRQLPDAEKRRLAHFVVDTTTLDTARAGVTVVRQALAFAC